MSRKRRCLEGVRLTRCARAAIFEKDVLSTLQKPEGYEKSLHLESFRFGMEIMTKGC